jgi:CBS domain-containing protein
MEDVIDEELKIAKEQDSLPASISSKIFQEKIKCLHLKEVITIKDSACLKEALEMLRKHDIGSLVITNANGLVAGILTGKDLIKKVFGKIKNWEKVSVQKIMTPGPFCLKNEDKISRLMHNIYIGGHQHIPIIDDEQKPIHMVSIRDVITFIVEHFPVEIDNIIGESFEGETVREGA